MAGVARRCQAGHPQVITTYPIYWGRKHPQVFPTLYWLTCPALSRAVGRLETEGWVERLQQQMGADAALAERWEISHGQYAHERALLVHPKELALLREQYPAQAQVLEETGVGGARGRGIKCLHTNLAHRLAKDANPIGELVAQLLVERGVTVEFCHDDALERFCRGDL